MSNHSNPTNSHDLGAPMRGSGVFVEHHHNAYRSDCKLPDTTMCRECHASIHDGRWQWLEAPVGSNQVLCPACRRIHDDFPAGFVSVEGDFFPKHRVELVHLVETRASHATAEHPLRRLIGAEDTPEGVMFTTTDIHLAREIGDALHAAYGGEVSFHCADEQDLLRVHWKR